MKRGILVNALAAGFLFIFSGSVSAQSAPSPLYLRVDAGYAWSKDANIRDNGQWVICANEPCDRPSTLNDIGDSYVLGAGVGYRVNSNIRAELAAGYRGGFELDEADSGVPPTTFKGKIRSLSLMLNGYYDFDVAGPWKPYVTAGVGVARNKFRTISATNPAAATLPALFSNFQLEGDTDTSFAWTLGFGVGYSVGSGMTLDIGYRYADLGDLKVPAQVVSFNPGPVSYAGAKGELKAHELTVGLRF